MRWLPDGDFLGSDGLEKRCFGRASTRLRRMLHAGALLVAGMGVSGLAWHAVELTRATDALERELAQRAEGTTALQRPAPPSVPPAHRVAVAGIVARLNFDWVALLNELEQRVPMDVAVIEIEPRPAQSLLLLTIEAASAAAALSCLQSLNASQRFADGRVLKHEVNERDGNKPLRFVLALQLRTAKSAEAAA